MTESAPPPPSDSGTQKMLRLDRIKIERISLACQKNALTGRPFFFAMLGRGFEPRPDCVGRTKYEGAAFEWQL